MKKKELINKFRKWFTMIELIVFVSILPIFIMILYNIFQIFLNERIKQRILVNEILINNVFNWNDDDTLVCYYNKKEKINNKLRDQFEEYQVFNKNISDQEIDLCDKLKVDMEDFSYKKININWFLLIKNNINNFIDYKLIYFWDLNKRWILWYSDSIINQYLSDNNVDVAKDELFNKTIIMKYLPFLYFKKLNINLIDEKNTIDNTYFKYNQFLFTIFFNKLWKNEEIYFSFNN